MLLSLGFCCCHLLCQCCPLLLPSLPFGVPVRPVTSITYITAADSIGRRSICSLGWCMSAAVSQALLLCMITALQLKHVRTCSNSLDSCWHACSYNNLMRRLRFKRPICMRRQWQDIPEQVLGDLLRSKDPALWPMPVHKHSTHAMQGELMLTAVYANGCS
jgi:hypothetical protein